MPTGRVFGAAWALRVALVLFFVSGCGSKEAFLLTIRTPKGQSIEHYALTVQERSTRQIVYRSGVQQVDPSAQGTSLARDLSGEPLKLGLLLSQRGSYLLHIRAGTLSREGVNTKGSPYFFAAIVQSQGVTEVDAQLLSIEPGQDQDGDFFPDATAFVKRADAGSYLGKEAILDCVDRDPQAGQTPLPQGLRAADIHPLAQPRCGLQMDVTCGGRTQTCLDSDGDGDPAGSDCDDRDPRRYHKNPRPRNCCTCTDRASCAKDHSKLPADLCQPKRCDNDFDFDCTGLAVDCFTDEDCDGYSPDDPVESQRDCDDKDARVYPGAEKNCADPSKDWACDGNPQGGCVDCDLDGDGYQRKDDPGTPGAHCPTMDDKHPGQPDCDDEDRGVFPGSTRFEGASLIIRDLRGQEGGSVAAALRGLCRNTTPRGPPQDADCDGSLQKGCPTATCDTDGDGFPTSQMGCNPLGLPIDCDDKDPQTFPGAPDFCKDLKAQNCSTPLPCTDDADGDGYNKDVDCNNDDPKIYPFAPEVCNGKDDDCDGLIDELNPDLSGKRLIESKPVMGMPRSSTTSCTDSNVGECGALRPETGGYTGRCVCTGVAPTSKPNLQDRTACAGEKRDNSYTPKCFFANQPQQQTCDADTPKDEDCDGRKDAPDGKNLKEYGLTCGVTTGECKAGLVVGCDRTKLNPFSAAAGRKVSPAFDEKRRYLVCDEKTLPPKDELCNGMDDDCDGVVPGQGQADPPLLGDEADRDGDQYMSCSGCTGLQLALGLVGCSDCNDKDMSVYPGATEYCDNKDNGCAGAGYKDGKDDCKVGDKDTCCAGTPMCLDLKTNLAHCGLCNRACSTLSANRCDVGVCKCGTALPCEGATPVCKDGMACVQCTLDAHCPALYPKCNGMNSCVECLANADCPAAKPGCSPAGICVQCVADDQCPMGKPKCSPANLCVECLADANCPMGKPKCSPANLCVECLADANCPMAKPKCTPTNACVECIADGDCPMGKPKCNAQNACVECLVNADCPMGKTCMAGVCG